jgi:hypothetical protein
MLYDAIHGMLEIKEKEVAGAGEVTLHYWVGPSDAIESYVPRRDRTTEGEHSTICISLSCISLTNKEQGTMNRYAVEINSSL